MCFQRPRTDTRNLGKQVELDGLRQVAAKPGEGADQVRRQSSGMFVRAIAVRIG
jgi:hypothetical protein